MVELIEHKGKSLLYPILMCSVVNFILTSAVKAVITGEYKKLIAGIPFDSLWFLWSVLSCSIAVAFAVKLSKNRVIQVLLFAAGLIIVAILPTYEMNLYMYPYFIIGYIYAENKDGWKPAAKIISVISIVAFAVMLVFFEKKYYIYTSGLLGGTTLTESLIIDLYRWAIGLFGSISIAFICGLIYRFIKNWRLTRDIEYLGQNSIAAYALSVSLLSSWLPAIAKRVLELLPWIDWNKCMWLYNLVVTPIVAVFYAVLLQLIIKLLKKGKAFRLIFGR